MTDLERAILKKLLDKGYGLNPMDYVQDGQYTDYDEWDSVNLGGGLEFDINFYSDGDYFYITAYDLIQTDSGLFIRNDSSFFHIYKTKLEGVVA
jgi:hypothetical protein